MKNTKLISIAVFTYKRLSLLRHCIESINSKFVGEVLIFNDDETQDLIVNQFSNVNEHLRIFNPADFGFTGRLFRKPIYINKAVELAKFDKILLSDDDGIFFENAIALHHNYLDKYNFIAGSVIRNKYFNRKSKNILQGTNYSFHKDFFQKIGGYNEQFSLSSGGGDPEFWYRVYKYVQKNNIPVAYLNSAIQKVISKKSRNKKNRKNSPKEIFEKIHNFQPKGKMYKWFPQIRHKAIWMEIIK
ncbi:MAG: hypothetical protein ISS38_03360 [Candidatus Cloacimonetes bacterium]|nr:hypothetical protein [Candidatus Cloacimonadota bacterium]